MIPFNYHHLYYFYVIAQQGSIVKATKVLRLAQPTLSAQLKQFESFLKTPLFIRNKKKLILTEEGRQVLSYAQMIFDIGQELKGSVMVPADKKNVWIRIGVPNFVPRTIVEKLLSFILERHPQTRVIVKEERLERLLDHLQNYELDLILADGPVQTQGLMDIESRLIDKIPMVFCANVHVARKIRQFPKDLEKVPMILQAEPSRTAFMVHEYLAENSINPHVIAEIPDIELIRRLVLRGIGVALVNKVTVQQAPAQEKLVILHPQKSIGLYRSVYLISKRRGIRNPLVKEVLNEFHIGGD